MKTAKKTFIFPVIHDFKKPVEVTEDYIQSLKEQGIISTTIKNRALKGKPITIFGYDIILKK